MERTRQELLAAVRGKVKGGAHAAVVCKDIEHSIEFYTQLLGFECYYRVSNHGVPLAFLRNKGLEIELIQFPENGEEMGVPSYKEKTEDGPVAHICIYGEDLQEMMDAMKELGVQVDGDVPMDNPEVNGGSACFFFHGPDHESIEVMI